jgi:Tfp pilus assembly protein PilF
VGSKKKKSVSERGRAEKAASRASQRSGGAGPRETKSKRDPGSGHVLRWLRSPAGISLVVFVVSFVLYANTLGNDYVWDDVNIIARNESVRTLNARSVLTAFTSEFATVPHRQGSYYRPLTTLSYNANYRLTGAGPHGFHFVNALVNALTCVLVFGFVYMLFESSVLALMTAILFAVHPIHTESVAWISGRTDVLATLWMLVSLIGYVAFRRRRRWRALAVSLVAFMLALFAKESAVCLPLIVILLELASFRRLFEPKDRRKDTTSPQRGRPSVVIPGLYVAVLAAYLFLRWNAIGTTTSTHPSVTGTTLSRLALPFSVLAGYVWKVLVPFRLNSEYDALIPTSLLDPHVIAGFVCLLLILWSALRFRSRPVVVLGTGIFLLGLAPVAQIIPIGEISAERFLYFPSLGMCLILGWVFTGALTAKYAPAGSGALPRSGDPVHVQSAWATPALMLFAVILIAFAARTVTRNRDWKNDEAMFTKTVAQAPNSPRAQVNMGNVARAKGDLNGAIRSYKTAIAINPNYTEALSNLAGIYAGQGKYAEATALMEQALRSWPDNIDLHKNLGLLYLQTKQYNEAAKHGERALALDPDDVRAHYIMGLIRMGQKNVASAEEHFLRAAHGGPDYVLAYYYLAVIESEAGSTPRSKEYAQRFLAGYGKADGYRQKAQALVSGP